MRAQSTVLESIQSCADLGTEDNMNIFVNLKREVLNFFVRSMRTLIAIKVIRIIKKVGDT